MSELSDMILNSFVEYARAHDDHPEPERQPVPGGCVIAAIVPAVAMTIIYMLCTVAPFGDRLLLCSCNSAWFGRLDSFKQALNGGSIFYSFTGGFGGECWSDYRDGFFSPFTLLCTMFTESGLPECLAIMTIMRSMVAGMFCYLLLMQLSFGSSLASLAISTGYSAGSLFALSFLAPQFSDAAVFLPLVGLGTALLSRRGSVMPLFFGIMLFLLTSSTLWPMLAVYLIMFYLFCNMIYKPENAVSRTGLLIFSAAIAVGVDAFVLVPSLVSDIENGSVIYRSHDVAKFGSVIAAMFSGSAAQNGVILPLIACSSLPLLLAPAYFVHKKFSIGERQIAGLFMFFIILSIMVPSLAAVWLGFSAPTGVVAATGTALALMAAAVSARLCGSDGGIRTGRILGAWVIALIAFSITALRGNGDHSIVSWIFAAAFLTLTAALALSALAGRTQKTGLYLILMILVCLDCVAGGYIAVSKTLNEYNAYDQERIAARYLNELTLSNVIKEKEGSNSANVRVRGADLEGFMCLDAPADRTLSNRQLTEALGVKDDEGYTPVTDALFGIKYIVLDHSDDSYDMLGMNSGRYLHRADTVLPLAFPASRLTYKLTTYSTDPFVSQNMLTSAIAGAERELFVSSQIAAQQGHGCQVSNTTTGQEIIRSESTAYVEYVVTVPTDGTLYMYLSEENSAVENVAVNGVQLGQMRLDVVNKLGSFGRGEQVKVYISVTGDRLAVNGVHFATMARSLTKASLEELAHSGGTCSINGSTLTVQANIDEGQLLMTTIPWQSGWHVTVDGEKSSAICTAGSFLAVDTGAGAHEVVFSYSPPDFTASLIISIFSFIVSFIFMLAAENARRRNEDVAAMEAQLAEQYQREEYQPVYAPVYPQEYMQPVDYEPYGQYEQYEQYEGYEEYEDYGDSAEYDPHGDLIPELIADDESPEPDEYGYFEDDDGDF